MTTPASASDFPKSILLVDDYEPWRCWVRSKLAAYRQFGIIGEAVNGAEAIQKAYELRPDLMLLDIGLPDMSGIEVARRIHETNAACEILFVTLNLDAEVRSEALGTGAKGYLLKTTAANCLVPAIEILLKCGHFSASA